MDKDTKKEIIDVAYRENLESTENSKQMIYTCKQVSIRTGLKESTVRYYCKYFDELLDVKVGLRNEYTETTINNLLFIKKLIEEGLTLKQIKQYCSENGFDNNDRTKLDTQNPLEVKVVMKAIVEEFNDRIDSINDNVNHNYQNLQTAIGNFLIDYTQELTKTVQNTVNKSIESIVSDKVSEVLEDNKKLMEGYSKLQNDMNTMLENQKLIKEENEQIHELQKRLAERKENYQNRTLIEKLKDKLKGM